MKNLTRITADYSKNLYDSISEYGTVYDYRNSGDKKMSENAMNSVENTVNFLTGRR